MRHHTREYQEVPRMQPDLLRSQILGIWEHLQVWMRDVDACAAEQELPLFVRVGVVELVSWHDPHILYASELKHEGRLCVVVRNVGRVPVCQAKQGACHLEILGPPKLIVQGPQCCAHRQASATGEQMFAHASGSMHAHHDAQNLIWKAHACPALHQGDHLHGLCRPIQV